MIDTNRLAYQSFSLCVNNERTIGKTKKGGNLVVLEREESTDWNCKTSLQLEKKQRELARKDAGFFFSLRILYKLISNCSFINPLVFLL